MMVPLSLYAENAAEGFNQGLEIDMRVFYRSCRSNLV